VVGVCYRPWSPGDSRQGEWLWLLDPRTLGKESDKWQR
jgi:hypothetical protein